MDMASQQVAKFNNYLHAFQETYACNLFLSLYCLLRCFAEEERHVTDVSAQEKCITTATGIIHND